MSSKLTGDWGKLKIFVDKFPKDLVQGAKTEIQKDGEEIKEYITSTLKSGGFEHTPLQPDTVKRKGHGTTLVDTERLAESYTVTQQGDSLVIHPEGEHDDLSMQDLAIIHEYGTQHIPPRPTIQPTHDKFKKEVPQDIKAIVEGTINKYV